MDTNQNIVKNTFVLLIAQLVNIILSMIYTLYAARYLGVESFGILNFGISITNILAVFMNLGLNTLMTREISRDKSIGDIYFGNSIIMRMILILVSFAMTVIIILLSGFSNEMIIVIIIMAISTIFLAFSQIFYAIFQAFEKMEYQAISLVLNSVIILIGILLSINKGMGLNDFALVYLIANIITAIFGLIVTIDKISKPKISIDIVFWKSTIIEVIPFSIILITGIVYSTFDSIMLMLFKGSGALGVYSAAYKLVALLVIIPNIVNIAIFPVLSRYYIHSPMALEALVHKYMKMMLILGIPIGFGVTLLASRIISLLYGEGYAQSIIVLQILIWAIIFTYAGAAYTQLYAATNKQNILTKLNIFSMVLNIVLNIILISILSYTGAGISRMITEMFMVSSLLIITYKMGYFTRIPNIFRDLIKIIISSLIMTTFMLFMMNINLLILIVLAMAIYFTALLMMGGIDKDNILLFKNIILTKINRNIKF